MSTFYGKIVVKCHINQTFGEKLENIDSKGFHHCFTDM